jgi:hypothetical protein
MTRLYQASIARELEDEAQRLIEEKEWEDIMAWTQTTRETPFITETSGDYLLGVVVDLETYEKPDGGVTEYLLVRSYEPKTVETPEPAEKLFRLMGIDVVREYKKRAERAKRGIKGSAAACRYILAVVTGVNARGYAELAVSFTDDREDMAKEREARGGVYYVLHLKERAPQQKPAAAKTAAAPTAADDNDDIPF